MRAARFLGRARHTLAVLREPGKLPSWGARLRWVYWRHVRWYDGEVCHRCGRPVARGIRSWWHAPPHLWREAERWGLLCPACFVVVLEGADSRRLVYWRAVEERL